MILSKGFTLLAPAKINLSLEVLARRRDGFHELRMLMAGVGLYDELQFQPAGSLKLTCSDSLLDCGPANLVIRAALLLRKYCAVDLGAAIHLKKRIPAGAGLAGGSSDAAMALKGLNRLWNLNLGLPVLQKLALQLGSDIPYCLESGWAIACGRGEKLTKLKSMPELWVVLANPGHEVSTGWVFQNLKLIHKKKSVNHTEKVISLLKNRNYACLQQSTINDLESVTARFYPKINYMKLLMFQNGALASRMSGSGPTVWGLYDEFLKADKAYQIIRKKISKVFVASVLPQNIPF